MVLLNLSKGEIISMRTFSHYILVIKAALIEAYACIGSSRNNEKGIVRALRQGPDVRAATTVHGEGTDRGPRSHLQQSGQRNPRDKAPDERHQQSRHDVLRLREQGDTFNLSDRH